MSDPLLMAVIFTFLMIVATVVEMLTPSMGIFTVVAIALIVGATYKGFEASQQTGLIVLAVNLALFPLTILVMLKVYKRSPMTLDSEIKAGVPEEPGGQSPASPLDAFVGQEGKALTMLRPSGSVLIGEHRLNVTTQGKFVEPGTKVRVLKVQNDLLVVEPV
jgi:membrane-bound serine protease (ClpP class)